MSAVNYISVDEFNRLYRHKNQANKYNAKEAFIDGHRFASHDEARRYAELRLMERAGEISDLEVHPRFILQDGFRDKYSGKWINKISYTADFSYRRKGRQVVEDVKSKPTMTTASRIRIRMFQFQNRKIEFRIVEY